MMFCAWHRTGSWGMSNDSVAWCIEQFSARFVGGEAAAKKESEDTGVYGGDPGVPEGGSIGGLAWVGFLEGPCPQVGQRADPG